MNILILSCGSRNKIVQYFRKELTNKGNVVVTDMSELAPAIYEADKYYIVPRIDDPTYIECILDICKKEEIDALLTLIDPELSLISKNQEQFLEIGTIPIISDYESVERSFDKFEFNQFLIANNFNSMKCYRELDAFQVDYDSGNITFPVFVKPYNGSASINISKVESFEELKHLFQKFDNLMIQEYMDGREYGVDCYIDLCSSELVSVFIKEKLKMRAGETDKSVSVINEKILSLVKEFVQLSHYRGVIDIDLFEVNGEFYISEVNPRFGGGYPHAYESGINIPEKIINNINGNHNQAELSDYEPGIYMLKYNELKIIN